MKQYNVMRTNNRILTPNELVPFGFLKSRIANVGGHRQIDRQTDASGFINCRMLCYSDGIDTRAVLSPGNHSKKTYKFRHVKKASGELHTAIERENSHYFGGRPLWTDFNENWQGHRGRWHDRSDGFNILGVSDLPAVGQNFHQCNWSIVAGFIRAKKNQKRKK